jgi:hypothetical protein
MHRQRHVIDVHVHRDLQLAARAFREANVVEVRVRENDRAHVSRGASELA